MTLYVSPPSSHQRHSEITDRIIVLVKNETKHGRTAAVLQEVESQAMYHLEIEL
jgi:hypothetical protein